MATPVLMLIDMLGVKNRWQVGGRPAAEEAFALFQAVMTDAIEDDADSIVSGLFETDAALLICKDLRAAVRIARRAFVQCFLAAKKPSDDRLWLRGVIVPHDGTRSFRAERALSRKYKNVRVSRLNPCVLNAIAGEKSGFHGMRLLVGGGMGAGQNARRSALTLRVDGHRRPPFLTVRTPSYPPQLAKQGFADFFWMATEDEHEESALHDAMANRIKWSAGIPDEFMQAASTQVVFNHWRAFVNSLGNGALTSDLLSKTYT